MRVGRRCVVMAINHIVLEGVSYNGLLLFINGWLVVALLLLFPRSIRLQSCPSFDLVRAQWDGRTWPEEANLQEDRSVAD